MPGDSGDHLSPPDGGTQNQAGTLRRPWERGCGPGLSITQGRRRQPTAHLGTGYAVQGAARPAAPPPAPAAARTGPTPRPPAGLGAGPPALSPASREPGQGQGGRRKGGFPQRPPTSPGQQCSGLPNDLATLRPKAAMRAILLTLFGQAWDSPYREYQKLALAARANMDSTTFSWTFPWPLPAARVHGTKSCLP